MNRPSAMTRFLGQRRVAAALYVGCTVAVLGWFGGAVPWWMGFIALCFVGTVRKAVRDVRRYDQWRGDWDAMGSAPQPAPLKTGIRKRKASSPWVGVVVASVWLVIIPMVMRATGDDGLRNVLTLLWLANAGYLVIRLAVHFGGKRSSVKTAPAMPAPTKANSAADVVQWVLPRASSSPSRAEAMRQLPGYCARLLDRAHAGNEPERMATR